MYVFYVFLFLISASIISGTEYVPVLVWSTKTAKESYPEVPALSRLSTNEFTDYLLKRVKFENPVILNIMEENLSVEDFSWKDVDGNGAFPMLNNVTRMADDIAFIPSVHDPYKAIKKLRNHGYVWRTYKEQGFDLLKDGKNAIYAVKLDEPDYLEDRPDMLKRHDEKIAEIFNEVLNYRSNVMVIYSGIHNSWTDSEFSRIKRNAVADGNTNGTIIISDKDGVVKMSASSPIAYNGSTMITKIIGDPTVKVANDKQLILRVRFAVSEDPQSSVSVDFNITMAGDGWWTLNNITMDETQMKPNVKVEAPQNFSYFCNPEVVFANEKNMSFTFKNFQVQPWVGAANGFGPVVHCVPFFSIGILSGLVVVFLLSIVLAWGITMIMDINTNDRFDDPKGKTITITATD